MSATRSRSSDELPADPRHRVAPGSQRDPGRDYIQSIERGLAAIQAFTGDRDALSVTEVAQRIGVSRAAARRILFTLMRLGHVGSDASGLYRLEPAVLKLGYAYMSSQSLPELARPSMEKVANELGCSCALGVLSGNEVIFVVRVRPLGYVGNMLAVGTPLPPYLTAIGRVLLADLPDDQIDRCLSSARPPQKVTQFTLTAHAELKAAIQEARPNGYALIDQELGLGVRALAVPIRNEQDRVFAALNVAVPAQGAATETVASHLSVLRRGADEISTVLRLRPEE